MDQSKTDLDEITIYLTNSQFNFESMNSIRLLILNRAPMNVSNAANACVVIVPQMHYVRMCFFYLCVHVHKHDVFK